MRVEYQSTLEDVKQLASRVIRKDPQTKNTKRSANLAFIVTLIIIVICALIPQKQLGSAIFAFFCGVLLGVVGIVIFIHKSLSKDQTDVLIEARGSDGLQKFAIEIDESTLKTWHGDCYAEQPVSHIERIDDTPDFIEFWMRGGGLIGVAKRAFQTPEAAVAFLNYARDCARLADWPAPES